MGNDITGPLNCYDPLVTETSCNFLISNASISGVTIVGTVVVNECDPCIKVASGSLVTIYRGNTLVDTVRANGCGNFVFTNLPAGLYTICSKKKGRVSKPKSINVLSGNVYLVNLLEQNVQ